MNKINELTRRLLAEGYTPEGYTPEDTPPGMREYSPYDGGWTYDSETLGGMVFETPCGLLAEGWHFRNGYLAYQGIDWRAENDNPVLPCPGLDNIWQRRAEKLLDDERIEELVLQRNAAKVQTPPEELQVSLF